MIVVLEDPAATHGDEPRIPDLGEDHQSVISLLCPPTVARSASDLPVPLTSRFAASAHGTVATTADPGACGREPDLWRTDVAANQWPLIRAERVALIADLENVTDAQWSTQSLCSAWTVRDVLAHMTTTAKMTPGRFFGKLAGSGFRFNVMNDNGVKEEQGATPADALAGFKAQLDRTTAPPGPLDAMVGEIVIHSQDIRRPLGIAHTFQPEAVTLVGDRPFSRSGASLLHNAGLTELIARTPDEYVRAAVDLAADRKRLATIGQHRIE